MQQTASITSPSSQLYEFHRASDAAARGTTAKVMARITAGSEVDLMTKAPGDRERGMLEETRVLHKDGSGTKPD